MEQTSVTVMTVKCPFKFAKIGHARFVGRATADFPSPPTLTRDPCRERAILAWAQTAVVVQVKNFAPLLDNRLSVTERKRSNGVVFPEPHWVRPILS